jgi:hypothetical protein
MPPPLTIIRQSHAGKSRLGETIAEQLNDAGRLSFPRSFFQGTSSKGSLYQSDGAFWRPMISFDQGCSMRPPPQRQDQGGRRDTIETLSPPCDTTKERQLRPYFIDEKSAGRMRITSAFSSVFSACSDFAIS